MSTFRDTIERILSNVDIDSATGCHIYLGNIDTEVGYGRVMIDNRRYHTHRLSAYLHLGLDLDNPKEFACHKCESRACCNFEHLYVGDNRSNQLDAKSLFCSHGHDLSLPFATYRHKRTHTGGYFNACRLCRLLRQLTRTKKGKSHE